MFTHDICGLERKIVFRWTGPSRIDKICADFVAYIDNSVKGNLKPHWNKQLEFVLAIGVFFFVCFM